MACLGAGVSGILVGLINADFGYAAALTAATKQAAYAFVATGLIAQFCIGSITGPWPGLWRSAWALGSRWW